MRWMWVLLLSLPALAHDRGFTDRENSWLNRQRAVDGTKCCDEHDVHVGQDVEWRLSGGHYEVLIDGEWHRVVPGRMMRHDPRDMSPWGGQALLFYSPTAEGPRVWCFMPEPLT